MIEPLTHGVRVRASRWKRIRCLLFGHIHSPLLPLRVTVRTHTYRACVLCERCGGVLAVFE